MADRLTLGLDFGTESVRALLVDLRGREHASAVAKYQHGQIIETLPGSPKKLPPLYALQHPQDWIDSAARATRRALRTAGAKATDVIGLGVDFTSCTMLPALRDGTPLCLVERFAREPLAWPKLWKHHGAQAQTERINRVARERGENFLARYGGAIGLEWFFPKMLETLEHAPRVFKAAEVWLEAGDWFVWQLVGGDATTLPRSTCQAGYKGMWSADGGYPSEDFLRALHPDFTRVVKDKMPGRLLAPGVSAGGLSVAMAKRLGLREGTPVSAAIIDAHAGVPGAGAAEPGTFVMVLGTSSCHMLNSVEERFVPGVAGIVRDGILPGFVGYETGQAAVGDAFDWLRRLAGQRDLRLLSQQAAALAPGADGVLCLDWLNGCRTPLMDGSLTGAFTGLTLHHTPAHLYRALLEASAFGVRWIVDLLREHGVPVNRFVATGGLPHHNPLVVEVYADVLGAPITVHPCKNGPALGAAILGALAAGAFPSPNAAIRAMATARSASVVKPQRSHRSAYDELYIRYRELASHFSSP
ncbi:carbohydrate kinase FGGY [Chthoniobacter flavus Ellin428]|uniref:Carbohydrate kinase FGGY n=1 Tax=Chthoniobacter flavus Ellin428 TaxID=497964 RepID=B4D5G6_9BACT|nr:ribulokinase [Chthoniobacter flavus]EDY18371.1 carbohydrate kinase FGGY [Chthoniobacter flavus Ellin428]TCO91392.1 L-ribulokinase [Chthoniobacter flavus]